MASWQLDGGKLVLGLTDGASSTLSVPRVVQTEVDADTAAQLAQTLPRMLAPAPAT